MYRKMNAAHRHTGRMTSDPRMRNSNKAEVGFGMVGVAGLALVILLMLMLVSW